MTNAAKISTLPGKAHAPILEAFSSRHHGLNATALVRVPLRISPLGAHCDHQGGRVTGLTISHEITLAFAPSEDSRISLYSEIFPDPVSFSLSSIPPKTDGDWGNYARGAAAALTQCCTDGMRPERELRRGFRGFVQSTVPIGGLSSSAAVTIAYLFALATSNDMVLTHEETVRMVSFTENSYLGLQNGILDQSVICNGRPGYLVEVDCRSRQTTMHPSVDRLGTSANDPWELLVVYSGLSRNLLGTAYNQRVLECREAAVALTALACDRITPDSSNGGTPRLSDIPADVFWELRDKLPHLLAKRATHYFNEQDRVSQGVQAWLSGDFRAFGSVIAQSGQSSISLYDNGSPALITLHTILNETKGVYGARFCGGGFQGSAFALIDPLHRENIEDTVLSRYAEAHPQLHRDLQIFRCKLGDSTSVERL